VIAGCRFVGQAFFAGVVDAVQEEGALRELFPGAVSPPMRLPLEDLAGVPDAVVPPLLAFLQDAAAAWHASQPGVAFAFCQVATALVARYEDPAVLVAVERGHSDVFDNLLGPRSPAPDGGRGRRG
jgi:hypothetical protein